MEGVVSTSSGQGQISPSNNVCEVQQIDAEGRMRAVLTRMRSGIPEANRSDIAFEEEAFISLYKRFLDKKLAFLLTGPILNRFKNYEDIVIPKEADIVDALSHLVVIKLGGGLGTSMDCCGPKSLIPVKEERTFLDLTLQQLEALNTNYNLDMPLVLMNSSNTQQETDAYLKKNAENEYKDLHIPAEQATITCSMSSVFDEIAILLLLGARFPRLSADTGLPLAESMQLEPKNYYAWYPPGHGDVYRSFQESGLLDKFHNEGKTWLFISNIDNLGASPDPTILCWLEEQQFEFVMEVSTKTVVDRKGGTQVYYKGGLRLLEVAQVPSEHTADFLNAKKFNIFNTNNLWINLRALYIIQLEEAAGAAIKSFNKSMGLKVPRTRFLPVKMTSDFLLLRSNLFTLVFGSLVISPRRLSSSLPIVDLDHHFQSVQDLQLRIPFVPSMVNLSHLTLSGDVRFGPNGTVKIIAKDKEQLDIPGGSVLENKVVTGSLRVTNQ
ncbi:UTP--glucose-1-phosphate uridylyltransferase [Echinococcus granulosus]|uniref:UTP--glucose-1-phosphate uridylyltransferase n=1 Tax=Echinococcus granulosus TaxID=6210 RepID=W6UIP2_ECHGR|nr:UTP--glucose-1-phosphate uridylyltransferase [Echinococcus granulosus]EUB60986.1 UTP--glucose-1-phosphate uridylyltransferase [Echinococcus granulosus]